MVAIPQSHGADALPTGLVRAPEIAQITVLDAPPESSALRQAEAFAFQACIAFAVVPRREILRGRQCLQTGEDAEVPRMFPREQKPVADEGITRWQ
ncbi:hypothetical protein [Methylobacterium sp. B1]|uniref:hypothetical protein n=1 Tax=Methylobacterium sp. B1 TaxID=91459 RepID=UPI0005BA4016|nr:hypothetical protein [Methylobacterium sp. B1]